MKKICLLMMLFLLFAGIHTFTGCSAKPADTARPEQSTGTAPSAEETDPPETKEEAKATAEETKPEETLPPEKDTVSELAEPDYMTPFLDFSWEREYPLEYIVLHFTSNVVNAKEDPHDIEKVKEIFMQTKVSSNYIIDRQGKITCFIPENYAAWHAGVGTYANDEKYTNKMNKYSIGIEMLAIGSQADMEFYLSPWEYAMLNKDNIGFTDEQYASLKKLLKDICERYDLPYDKEHIIGHDEYNPKKNDPGDLFDWSRLFGEE